MKNCFYQSNSPKWPLYQTSDDLYKLSKTIFSFHWCEISNLPLFSIEYIYCIKYTNCIKYYIWLYYILTHFHHAVCGKLPLIIWVILQKKYTCELFKNLLFKIKIKVLCWSLCNII
jgi:hypothetical protein